MFCIFSLWVFWTDFFWDPAVACCASLWCISSSNCLVVRNASHVEPGAASQSLLTIACRILGVCKRLKLFFEGGKKHVANDHCSWKTSWLNQCFEIFESNSSLLSTKWTFGRRRISHAFNSGYGHCDVAAALLERKASFLMLCFLVCRIWCPSKIHGKSYTAIICHNLKLHRFRSRRLWGIPWGKMIPYDSCASRQIFTTAATLNSQPLQQLAR